MMAIVTSSPARRPRSRGCGASRRREQWPADGGQREGEEGADSAGGRRGTGGGGGSVGAVAQRVEEPAVGTGILAALGLRPDLGAAPQAGGTRGPPLRRDGRRR